MTAADMRPARRLKLRIAGRLKPERYQRLVRMHERRRPKTLATKQYTPKYTAMGCQRFLLPESAEQLPRRRSPNVRFWPIADVLAIARCHRFLMLHPSDWRKDAAVQSTAFALSGSAMKTLVGQLLRASCCSQQQRRPLSKKGTGGDWSQQFASVPFSASCYGALAGTARKTMIWSERLLLTVV
jgi:hypothetical protein